MRRRICQDSSEGQDIKQVNGTVSVIDWVVDKLVVRTNDFGDTDEMTFVVPDDTSVTKWAVILRSQISILRTGSLSSIIVILLPG